MSNDNGLNRRRFLGTMLASASAGIAGCGTAQRTETEEPDEEVDREEFLRYLKSTGFNIQENLSRTHESPDNREMVELSGDDDFFVLTVNEDLGTLLRGSTYEEKNADLYIASEFGLADEVLDDTRPELDVTADVVDTELEKFDEETDVPEDYELHIEIDIHGEGDANIGPHWEFGEATAKEELDELYEDASDSGRGEGFGSLTHGVYNEFSTISEGEAQTVSVQDTEHTIEYIETINEGTVDEAGVFRINGEVTLVDDYDSFSIDGQEYRVETNPVYVQDREEIEDGALFREF